MLKQLKYYFLIACALGAFACNNTRYLASDEQLYTGADVKIDSDSLSKKKQKALRAELKTLPRPTPNSSFLGMRPKLLAYHIAGTPKKTKGVRNWLRNKVGEAPVLASSVDLQFNRDILQNRLENKGYFNADITGDTTSRKQRVKAEYLAKPGPQYLIKDVFFATDSSEIGKAVSATFPKTMFKTGNPYNLEVIKGERDRIDQTLKEQGFYYFVPDYLLIKVDSTIGNHQVNLYLTIKPEIPKLAQRSYIIGDIFIYPNFSLNQTLADTSKSNAVLHEGYYVIDQNNTIKPSVFSRSMFFNSGEPYNRKAHNLSLNRLITIGSFKLVTNRFDLVENAPRPTLNTFYYLTPLPRKSLRGEVLATTKSNNLTGSELSLSWRNRNTFRGAEQLMIRGYGSFEMQFSGAQSGYNTFRLGTESTLSVPRFVVPFLTINTTNAYVPRTNFSLGYEILNKRELYTLSSFSTSAGYKWKENIKQDNELKVVRINYVQPANVTTKYQDSISNNPILEKTIEKQFIVGPTYSFTYTDQLVVTRKNNFFFNGNIDLAGNVMGLIQGADYRSEKFGTILGARYAQYVKTDGDFRYYLKTGLNSSIASRAIVGIGYPYGNSSELPFIKQFFAGGSNSIRAFMARSIGPGTFRLDNSVLGNFIPDQSGDIILEFNTEYRAKLAGVINGAVFIDAGNIWLFNDNPLKPGSKFSRNFINELAVGTGIGLRFDLSFLVLRTDLAFPVRKPWLPDGERWVFNQMEFTNGTWRSENLVFNLAIGYPF